MRPSIESVPPWETQERLEELAGLIRTTAQETVVLLTLMDDQLKMITVLQGEVESLQKRVSALVRAKRWR